MTTDPALRSVLDAHAYYGSTFNGGTACICGWNANPVSSAIYRDWLDHRDQAVQTFLDATHRCDGSCGFATRDREVTDYLTERRVLLALDEAIDEYHDESRPIRLLHDLLREKLLDPELEAREDARLQDAADHWEEEAS